MAGGLGFEPRLAESESAVLPLEDPQSWHTVHFSACAAEHSPSTNDSRRPSNSMLGLYSTNRNLRQLVVIFSWLARTSAQRWSYIFCEQFYARILRNNAITLSGNRVALVCEESVSVVTGGTAGSTRRTPPCASTSLAMTESPYAASRRQQ